MKFFYFPTRLGLPLCVLLCSMGCGSSTEEPQMNPDATVTIEDTRATLNKQGNVASYLLNRSDLQLVSIDNQMRTQKVKISGRVIPQNTTHIFAEVQGEIMPGSVPFKEGIAFKKGDLLLQLDNKALKLQLEAQRSVFLNALTGIMPDLKSDYPASYPAWLDYIQRYQFGDPLAELPSANSEEEKYYLTSNQVYNLYFAIKAQEEILSKYQIIAPYSGIITQANIDLGSLVLPGQPIGTIINRYHYELEAGAPLAIANTIQVGQELTFSSNEIDGQWMGKVVRVNNVIDPGTQNISVYFRLAGKNLRVGMYLEGQVAANSLEQVSTIPSSALGRDKSVLVLENEVITPKSVIPLEYLGDSILISGLQQNDLLILNQFAMPVAGTKVNK